MGPVLPLQTAPSNLARNRFFESNDLPSFFFLKIFNQYRSNQPNSLSDVPSHLP